MGQTFPMPAFRLLSEFFSSYFTLIFVFDPLFLLTVAVGKHNSITLTLISEFVVLISSV